MLLLRLELTTGAHIQSSIEEAITLAKGLNKNFNLPEGEYAIGIVFETNGIDLEIYPDSELVEVLKTYRYELIERRGFSL